MDHLPISEVYKVVTRQPIVQANGLKQYPVIKKYAQDMKNFTEKSTEPRKGPKQRNLRLRTYLDQQQKRHRHIPGPGKYNLVQSWQLNQKGNGAGSERKTYLDQIIREMKRNKSPGPGQYQNYDLKQSKSFSRLNTKRQNSKARLFFSDEREYLGANIPGPGEYNIRTVQKKDLRHPVNQNPQQSIRKFRAMSEKKLQALPKLPGVGSYNPEASIFSAFEALGKQKSSKKGFGVGQRFKTMPSGSNLSPDKYSVLNAWRGKGQDSKTYQKHGLDILSKPQLRVYY